jgi:hypothetical protein
LNAPAFDDDLLVLENAASAIQDGAGLDDGAVLSGCGARQSGNPHKAHD